MTGPLRTRTLPARAWKYPSSWEVRLRGNDGSSATRSASSYEDAKTQRNQALTIGRYYQAWIEEKR